MGSQLLSLPSPSNGTGRGALDTTYESRRSHSNEGPALGPSVRAVPVASRAAAASRAPPCVPRGASSPLQCFIIYTGDVHCDTARLARHGPPYSSAALSVHSQPDAQYFSHLCTSRGEGRRDTYLSPCLKKVKQWDIHIGLR